MTLSLMPQRISLEVGVHQTCWAFWLRCDSLRRGANPRHRLGDWPPGSNQAGDPLRGRYQRALLEQGHGLHLQACRRHRRRRRRASPCSTATEVHDVAINSEAGSAISTAASLGRPDWLFVIGAPPPVRHPKVTPGYIRLIPWARPLRSRHDDISVAIVVGTTSTGQTTGGGDWRGGRLNQLAGPTEVQGRSSGDPNLPDLPGLGRP